MSQSAFFLYRMLWDKVLKGEYGAVWTHALTF